MFADARQVGTAHACNIGIGMTALAWPGLPAMEPGQTIAIGIDRPVPLAGKILSASQVCCGKDQAFRHHLPGRRQ